jgi:UDP-N-acetylmuramoyl-tripeptide--D-alanyl-D-alanine ligase
VQQGLARAGHVAGRLRRVRSACGATLFDDSYNANPASVGAAIEFLASLPGESWLVFGDMGELGADSDALHRQVGERARDAGIQRLFCVGERSLLAATAFGPTAQHFATAEQLAAVLKREAGPGITILVKASRFMGLEKVVNELAAAGEGH